MTSYGPYNIFSGNERAKGERIIKKAIEMEELIPKNQTKCCICGQDKGIRDYHCEDYSPKNVVKNAVPICRYCHRKLHDNIDKHPEKWEKHLEDVRNGFISPPSYNKKTWLKDKDSEEIIESRSGCIRKIQREHEKFRKLMESEK